MVTKPIEPIKVVGVDVTPALETGRRAWWAYLGAWGLAQDEVEDLVQRLVKRGTVTEKEGRKLLDEALGWPQKGFKAVEAEVQDQIEAVLKRFGVLTRADIEKMNLPTRSDIQALGEKVAALTKKVEALRKQEEPKLEKAPAPKAPAAASKVAEAKKAVAEAPAETAKVLEAR